MATTVNEDTDGGNFDDNALLQPVSFFATTDVDDCYNRLGGQRRRRRPFCCNRCRFLLLPVLRLLQPFTRRPAAATTFCCSDGLLEWHSGPWCCKQRATRMCVAVPTKAQSS